MRDIKTWVTDSKCVTVRSGDVQADVSTWANGEGVTVAVTGKGGANLLVGSLQYEEMEALCAAFAMIKTV